MDFRITKGKHYKQRAYIECISDKARIWFIQNFEVKQEELGRVLGQSIAVDLVDDWAETMRLAGYTVEVV